MKVQTEVGFFGDTENVEPKIPGSIHQGGPPGGTRGPGARAPKAAKVKNKTPAEIQITAEQILREAKDRQPIQEPELVRTRQKITDEEELKAYKLRKRRGFEENIRKNKNLVSNWYKYAEFEANLKEYDRSRSIYERALDMDHRNPALWCRYAEMEMKNEFINRARNVWQRAVTTLPRADQLWLKWIHMEETLGNVPGARQVFEQWMQWQPAERAWQAFVDLEKRYGELERARSVIQRFVMCHNKVASWLYYAKFEEKNADIARARQVYETAIEALGDAALDENLFIAFAKFEERRKQFERARAIYKHALDNIPKAQAQQLYQMFTAFERQQGDTSAIEEVVISQKRFNYEQELQVNPHNYDVWFDYIRLEESGGDGAKCRDVYERAIANVPKVSEKQYWSRYIYLWIMYAVYEELVESDIDKTREIYEKCLRLCSHRKISFSKMWIMYAHFEIRQQDLTRARKIFGSAVGKHPTNKLFRNYIEMELQLGNLQAVRRLYQKWLEYNPTNSHVWIKFAVLEKSLEEWDRVRALFGLAVQQPILDMPEVVWKEFIDFEIEQKKLNNARRLYQQLVEKTHHFKVYIALAMFELNTFGSIERAREVFHEGYTELSADPEARDGLAALLNSWKMCEEERGTPETVQRVEDLINPDRKRGAGRLLAKAQAWKRRKLEAAKDAPPAPPAADDAAAAPPAS